MACVEKAVKFGLAEFVAGVGRTTIVIAHRLSTIQAADLILGARWTGDSGPHPLQARGGLNASLVEHQMAGVAV
jgi:ABC-type multidrug transport system fused ATPase/permease subunit